MYVFVRCLFFFPFFVFWFLFVSPSVVFMWESERRDLWRFFFFLFGSLLFLLCFFLLLVSWEKNTQGRNGKKPELGNQWDTQENGDERTGACVSSCNFFAATGARRTWKHFLILFLLAVLLCFQKQRPRKWIEIAWWLCFLLPRLLVVFEAQERKKRKKQGMTEVVLHVYDVTNSGSGRANATIRRLNKILRDGMGIGGIFHGALQVRHLYCNGFIEAKKRPICKKRKEKVLYKS